MSVVAEQVWGDTSNALHADRLRRFRERGIGEVVEADGAFAIVTGPTSNIENGVVCDRPKLPAGEAERLVSWIRRHEVPSSWIQGDLDASERLHAELLELGCHEETTGVDMGARIENLDLGAGVDGIEIVAVRDPAGLRTWTQVADRCDFFDDPTIRDGQERLYAAAGFEGPFRHWLAQRDGTTVGIATAFFGSEAVLLEHVGVLPEERRRGIGTALVAVRLREAAERSCDVAALGPTPASQAFFERLGFTLTRVRPRRWYYL